MNLSQFPDLKSYRDDLAAKLRKGGGSRAAALERANLTAHRVYEAAIHEADARKPYEGISDRDISASVGRVVAEVRRTAGVAEVGARKPQGKKKRNAAISEAARQAAARAVAEALNGTRTPGAPAAADNRPLHELAEDELLQRLEESYAADAAAARAPVRETAAPAGDSAPTGEELRKMGDDELLSYMGGVLAQQADAMRPPAGAIPSPFWAGADGR